MHQINTWMDSLPEPSIEIAYKARDLIFETVNGVEERYSYKLPVYHYFGMFCFLTYNRKLKVLDVTFMRGKDLTDIFPQLQVRNRSLAASIELSCMADIYSLQLQEVISTAAAWQKEAKLLHIPFMRKKKTFMLNE